MFRFLAGFASIAPVFVTLGNHDHYSGVPIDHYCELADRHKITLLINQATFISTDCGEIAIVGVDDPSLHRADLSCLPPRRRTDSPSCWPMHRTSSISWKTTTPSI